MKDGGIIMTDTEYKILTSVYSDIDSCCPLPGSNLERALESIEKLIEIYQQNTDKEKQEITHMGSVFINERDHNTLLYVLDNCFTLYDTANKDAIIYIINNSNLMNYQELTSAELHLVIYHLCNEIIDLSNEVKVFRSKYSEQYDKFDGLVGIEADSSDRE